MILARFNRANGLIMGSGEEMNKRDQGREVCYRCFKPRVVCICADLVRVKNRTAIIILQHKCERFHPIGTARIANLGLENVELRTILPDDDGRFTCPPLSIPDGGLLFPGDGSRDLSDLGEEERPGQLVVLDGSWSDARKLFQHNPWLQSLPRYSLTPSAPSRYRIRTEPSEESVSTIEAIVQSLQILEPETPGLESLLDVFEGMIDDQIRFQASSAGDPAARRVKRFRQREDRSIPPILREGLDNLVMAYGESVPHPGKGRALISWAAIRAGDGSRFERFILPPPGAVVTEDHLDLMGLRRDHFGRAVTHEELAAAWDLFAGPCAVVVTWNRSTLDLFARTVGAGGEGLFLKEIYGNRRGGKCGHLGEVVRRENLEARRFDFAGRAGSRVGELDAVARYLLRMNSSECRPSMQS